VRSKGNAPNKKQVRWREEVRSLGSILSGENAIIHHCSGAASVHRKIPIGHEWILPLTESQHYFIHKDLPYMRELVDMPGASRKEIEKHLFEKVVYRLGVEQIGREVYESIMDYRI